jgi:hypothetical protein
MREKTISMLLPTGKIGLMAPGTEFLLTLRERPPPFPPKQNPYSLGSPFVVRTFTTFLPSRHKASLSCIACTQRLTAHRQSLAVKRFLLDLRDIALVVSLLNIQ